MNIKINQIVENLKTLTLLECVSLIKEIEKVFDINIIPVTTHNTTSQVVEEVIEENKEIAQAEEKSSYKITLLEVPSDKKIAILKIVRNLTGLGLKESKEIVDNVPKFIKEVASKEESELIKKDLEALGAKVDVQ